MFVRERWGNMFFTVLSKLDKKLSTSIWTVNQCATIMIIHHHHHQVMLRAQIPLTLFSHPSLLSIGECRLWAHPYFSSSAHVLFILLGWFMRWKASDHRAADWVLMKKWIWWLEFKSRMRLFMLMLFGKSWILIFSPRLWVNSRTGWAL